jgi:peptidoglycan/LPS O-acetylase OafA/YrhL
MPNVNRTPDFRPDIEGLRAVAILLVVGFHCGIPGVTGGFIGVDVFFVLSGYLITGMLAAEADKTSRISLIDFYARRARRLLPAAALSLLVTVLVGIVILAPQEITLVGRAARAAAIYMSNMYFAVNAADYFAPDVSHNPVLHTWSLAVEEQFYLFWPLLIMLGLQHLKSRKALVIGLAGLTAISLSASVWLTLTTSVFAFYALPSRIWEFGIAGLFTLLPKGTIKLGPRSWSVVGWLGMLGIAVSATQISGEAGFPGWVAVLPVVSTVAVLVASAEHASSGAARLLGVGLLQWLGRLSYSWYLWHWPFLVFAMIVFPSISLGGRLIAATLALTVAAITHYWIENPVRFHPLLLKRPAWSLAFAALVTVFSFGAGTMSMRFASALASDPAMKSLVDDTAAVADISLDKCVTLSFDSNVKSCEFADANGPVNPVNVVLFGDSHAIQWFNPVYNIATERGWKLTTFFKSGCTAADVTIPIFTPAEQASCAAWRQAAIGRIAGLRPALAIVASATMAVRNGAESTSMGGISLKEWEDGSRRTFSALTAAGMRVASMHDTPHFAFDVSSCVARSRRNSWYPANLCQSGIAKAINVSALAAEKEAARALSDVTFVDLTDRLCHEQLCPPEQGGMLMYRDSHHLTGRFAETLAPALESKLLAILAGSTPPE